MAGSVSHKLNNSFEGALAGGGDPATSPLYVFGPFLKLIVVAGVAQITFGASVWLVVVTIAVVSAMYRLVMRWVTDGSGGSGLSEEEFGSWAVKVNAAITFIEYTLTFLVSMAAMVTFIADRFNVLNNDFLGIPIIQYRTVVAIVLSIFTGWLVNRGPKMAARAFGPATAGVLLLLWVMVFATIWREKGIYLPNFDLRAFTEHLHLTLGGYVRILAVMTGIEVFANLVAAYNGPPKVKSSKAFNSLLIIMGTTAVTMLIVGPAIFEIADPTNEHVSVFTQTMDVLLPAPLPYIGTLVGIAVLMSASAASAQGLQNLALGLRRRHYIPPTFGQRNRFEVADKPVWVEVAIVSVCFLFFGTHEETYLGLYAAGVFILLSMTGWAVTKRLFRDVKDKFSIPTVGLIIGTILAATLTTGATVVIFVERFTEGAWTYLIFIPALYAVFNYSRNQLGEPTPEMDYLGQLDAAQLAGFGFGQIQTASDTPARPIAIPRPVEYAWKPDPIELSNWRSKHEDVKKVVVLLDGSAFAASALPASKAVCKATGAKLILLSALGSQGSDSPGNESDAFAAREAYLTKTANELKGVGFEVEVAVRQGFITETTKAFVEEQNIDMIITSTRGGSGMHHWLTGGLSRRLAQEVDIPVLLVQSSDLSNGSKIKMDRILVALDGSIYSESALPYARTFARAFGSELVLLTVPAVPQMEDYRAAADVVESIRIKAEENMCKFLGAVAESLQEEEIKVRPIVMGSIPTSTILSISEEEDADLIMITTHGRGGFDFLMMGSVAQRVVQNTQRMVMLIPVQNNV